ncbi:MAG: DUF305 domain-containing protein [Pontimonas sp.]|nr:DUF305 domain-containing protein [Pontimonas sp.]
MTRNRITSAVTGVLVLALAAGCTINIGAPAAPSSEQGALAYSANDIMFAQMMIPHHQQAIELSDLAMEVSASEEVLDLAQRIKAGQDPEIEEMTRWLEQSGASSMMEGHDMGAHGMSGMVSEADLETLASLASPEFDVMFLELMIAHHEGALDMVSMIDNSANTEVRALAEAITVAQRAEIDEMKALLGVLGG